MRRFLSELRRRNVLRAGLLYIGAIWALAQGIAQLTPELAMPVWSTRAFVLAGAIGFPFWLAFAWFYELTPAGLRRESDVPEGESIARQTGRRLDYWIIGVLAAAVVLLLTDKFLLRQPATDKTGSEAGVEIPAASIAVLPLVNSSGDDSQDYFADGLTDELIAGLSKLDGLKVIGRSSAARFRDSTLSSAAIGRQLGVAHLLEGSVRQQGHQVRIGVNLFAAADSRSLWTQTFSRDLSDIFQVQTEIAQAVAAALQVQLVDPDQLRAEWPPSGDVEAYLAFLEARVSQRTATRQGLQASLDSLHKAIERDPRYATAHAALAMVNGNLFMRTADDREAEVRYRRDALAALDRAEVLAPDAPLTLLAKAEMLSKLSRDDAGARTAADRAYALYPDNELAMAAQLSRLGLEGRYDRMLPLLDRLVEIDPLRPHYLLQRARTLVMLGRLDEAVPAYRRGQAVEPDYPGLLYGLGMIELLRGKREHLADYLEETADPAQRLADQAMVQAGRGDREQAMATLQALDEVCHGTCFADNAVVYAVLGEFDVMYDLLEKGSRYAAENRHAFALLGSMWLRPFWDEPRFREIAIANGSPVPDSAHPWPWLPFSEVPAAASPP